MTLRRLPGLILALLLAAGPIAGCGEASGGSAAEDRRDPDRALTISGDENATADEIIDMGTPATIAASGGHRLITWQVRPDDGEGPHQAAWRLYDDDGRVADGKFGIVREAGAIAEVTGVADGFLIDNYTEPDLLHLDLEGRLTEVPSLREVRATRPGDVLISQWSSARSFYRPGDHAAYRLPRLPTRNAQEVRMDERGGVWVMLPWSTGEARIAHSPDGTGPWTTEKVDLPADAVPTIDLAVSGGRVLFPQATDAVSEYTEFTAVWERSIDRPGWRSIPLDDAIGKQAFGLRAAVASTGELVLMGLGSAAVQQPDGSFRTIRHPGGTDPNSEVGMVGDELYTTARRGQRLWMSADLGETWSEVQR